MFGVEAFITTRQNVNSKLFCAIFDEIKQNGDDFVCLLDNVQYHHSKYTKAYVKKRGIELVYNVPYSPNLNAIEKVFLQIKTRYRSLRLEAIVKGLNPTPESLIEKAIEQTKQSQIVRNCMACLERWQN